MNLYLGWDSLRAFAACCFIFVTTADDAVWLIPMLSRRKHHLNHVVAHSIVFCGTLQIICLLSWIICLIFAKSLATVKVHIFGDMSLDNAIQIFAIILTWVVAISLFIKSIVKAWRKRQRLYQLGQSNVNYESISHDNENPQSSSHLLIEEVQPPQEDAKVYTVFLLTLVGAIDEMICFPSFLLSKTFSILELCAGCFVASLVILLSITHLLTPCKPVLNFFDRIPLYGIVGIYATILTISYFMN